MLITVHDETEFEKYESDMSGNGIPEGKILLDHKDLIGFHDGIKIVRLKYTGYVGRGILYLRQALEPNDPNNLYNFIKNYGIEPERFGIEKPEVITDEYDMMSKEDLIKHIRRLEKQIDSGY